MPNRLRTNFRLSIVALFGVASVVGILPFAVYRVLTGAWAVAALDFGLVALIGGLTAYAWRRNDARLAARVLVFVYTGGAVASAELLGVVGLFWMYAVILANFFLVRPALAWAITGTAIAVLAANRSGFDGTAQIWSFTATALLVSTLAHILADRVDAQRQQLEQLASHDPLTGVYNRRAMGEELALAVETRKRTGQPVSLLLLDLDHFKRVNDEHGHDVGDRVLVDFARILRGSVRSVDRAFRYGGEEFVLLLPGMGAEALQAFGDKLRAKIGAELAHPGGRVTVSCGGAALRPGENWDHWLSRADDALYRAKSGGRDRIDIDPP